MDNSNWGRQVIEKALEYANFEWIPTEANVLHGVDEAGRCVDTPDVTWKGEELNCGWWQVGKVNVGNPSGGHICQGRQSRDVFQGVCR